MKILVTGASGFAGSHLIEALKSAGQSDIYGTAYGNSSYLATLIPEDHIIKVNLTDAEATFTLIEKVQPDQIYHLAAFAFVGESFDRAAELMQNNIALQLNMLEAVRKSAPKARLLVIGSAEEYGLSTKETEKINEEHPFRPVNPYAVSKIAQDLLGYSYQVSYGLQVLRVRPFNHIGERQTPDFAIPAFAKQIVEIERGKSSSLKVGNLDGVRDFTDVKDMVRAYMIIMEKGAVGEVYNIGTGDGVKMKDVVDKLVALSTAKIQIEVDQTRMRPLDIPSIIADPSKIMAFGWKPEISLDETLKRVVEYWRG